VSRPALEIADTFRRYCATWRAAHAGHVSLGQLKMMSTVESCRTAEAGAGAPAMRGRTIRCTLYISTLQSSKTL
jgi:hypothetical protein